MDTGWPPFNGTEGTHRLGEIDLAFLSAYSIGMFFAGHVGDRIDLRLFLVLSIGWPCVVAVVGNWFGKAKRGLIMGVWNSHTSVGNIIGSVVASGVLEFGWGWSFAVPGILVILVGVLVFLFLVVSPEDIGFEPLGMEIEMAVEVEGRENLEKVESEEAGLLEMENSDSLAAIGFLEAWRLPAVAPFAFCLFFSKLVAYTFLYWLPFYIRHTGVHLSHKTAGILSTLFDIGGVFGGILAGYISDMIEARAVTSIVFLLLSIPALISDLGTQDLIKGNSRALATVTAIIDGTGSVGAAIGPLLAGLIVDIVLHGKHMSYVEIQYLASDAVSVFTGLFLCYVGFLKIKSKGTLLEETLLNGDSSLPNNLESAESKGSDTVTPYSNAAFFSILTFSWMGSLIAVGNKKTLDLHDVPQLHGEDTGAGSFPVFRNKLGLDSDTAGGVTTFKLTKALILSYWKEILWTAFLALLYTSASFVGPYLIATFVQCLSGKGEFKNQGYFLASTFFVAKLVECLSQRHWFFRLQQIGIRIRAALVATIYNKGLTLSHSSKQRHTSGEIINYMAVDTERIGTFSWYIHDVWLIFLQVGLALLILYKNLGLASIAAFVATIIVMLLNYPLGRLEENFQDKMMESKDKRMKTTSEILRNMRILKLQGWEMKFLTKIFKIRKMEEGWLKKYFYTSAITNFVFWVAPTFVSVATFGACMLMGIRLESGKILSALATFGILQVPIYNLPDTISMIVQTKVSLDRIASFLCLEDLQSDVVEKLPRFSSDTAIEMLDGNFSWDLSLPVPTLKDLNFKVLHGTLKLSGTKAYVAQSPWIQSGTIEENILFGKEMDRERYERILEACSLKKDLEILSFADQTVIGERGINLSGGQKQRIQIARALYQDSDIYLLDDPFSAVDAHTGSHIFKEVLLDLLSSKTVIYVTHQVEFLPAADLILVLKDGRITQDGKYNDTLIPGSDFMELVDAHKAALSTLDSKPEGPLSDNGSMSTVLQKQENKYLQSGKADERARPKGQLIQEEEREKGRVGFPVYWKYITTVYGGALVPFILLAEILFQILQICSNYWMAWATPESKDVKPVVSESTLIFVYVDFAVGSSFCVLVRAILLVTAGYKTATLLFNKMHLSIFRAPMSFFDATPSGRILNRVRLLQTKARLICKWQLKLGPLHSPDPASGNHWSDVSGGMASYHHFYTCDFYLHMQYYIPSARELSRLVGVSKAPVFQHFAETISGSTTIRSFDQQSRFQRTNMKVMDAFCRPKFHIAGAMEWLCFRLDVFSSITFATSLVLLISFQDRIDPGGKKTGIVGRTGSGKSTLIQTLFRIVEPAAGQIVIDGINISSIGLHDLRSRLSIIPQEPTMFEGTVRSNLDPLEEYTDEQIWEALDKCQLGHEVRKKEKKLDSIVTENGENWSMGQRQLVCLGRVLLKRSKVLVLDEATASVDTATDNLIQQTIGQHFSDSTVITIAHRITSVLDSYMVLLLSDGLIEEYDSPTRLLQNKSSSFARLVSEYAMRSKTSIQK
ncbi:hypothetical protein GH714_007042 [Hevea brasiliensis]|uniref:ABC-type xenobiotic transporter n=1 Tax=Hevea brasiliensis TaxID=3981 RepID=A0A6A6KBA4_HEVBR|nr:hypothetical protein GH714_007042 [Hevea brasiliensis]